MKDNKQFDSNSLPARIQELLSCEGKDYLPLDEGFESRLAIENMLNKAKESVVAVVSGDDVDNWNECLLNAIPVKIGETSLSVRVIMSLAARDKFSTDALDRFGRRLYLLPDFANDVRPFLIVDGKYIRIAKEGDSRSFLIVNDVDFGALLTDIGVILTDEMTGEKDKQ